MLLLGLRLPLRHSSGGRRTTFSRGCPVPASCFSNAAGQGVGQRRVRQHVNPLTSQYFEPISLPVWNQVYQCPDLPLHVDIGCAYGKYLMDVAEAAQNDAHQTPMNFLGVEIRDKLVTIAQEQVQKRGLHNCHFVHANINVQIHRLFKSLPNQPRPITSLSIFHPDPWYKKKHHKRRLVNARFVEDLEPYLMSRALVYIQTDVPALFEDITTIFNENKRFRHHALIANPFGTPTDREVAVLAKKGSIYRSKYEYIGPT